MSKEQQEKQNEARRIEIAEAVMLWKSLVSHPSYKTILEIIEKKKGVYSESTPESQMPHIQSERNGGTKGWNLFRKHLSTLCNDESFIEQVIQTQKEQAEETYVDHTEF